jgi:hypothetical protein
MGILPLTNRFEMRQFLVFRLLGKGQDELFRGPGGRPGRETVLERSNGGGLVYTCA